MGIMFNIALLVITAFFCGLAAINLVHIFQLNSYKPKVQLTWLVHNIKRLIPFLILLLYSITAMLLIQLELIEEGLYLNIFYGVLVLFFSNVERPREQKKPLVYTMRVKRLLVTCGILFLICMVVDISVMENPHITGIFAGLMPLICLFANLINRPVELFISRYYVNDAKRMLKESSRLIVIGVTGSYGKTSVKYFLGTLMKAKYNVLITPESYNTPMGVVKTIRSALRATHDMFICEMGARNIGDIKELCDIVKPVSGVITSIGEQHLESFKSIDNIINTKFELEASLPDAGYIFLNGDNKYIAERKLSSRRKTITYGMNISNDYHAEKLVTSEQGSTFTVTAPNDEQCEFSTKLIGSHNVTNIVGAIAVAHTYGISLEELAVQVRKLEGVPHRLQLIRRDGLCIIDDAYNSNPNGAKAALEVMGMMKGFRILITPGMVELGDRQEALNRELGEEAAEVCDYVITVGRQQSIPICEGMRMNGFPEIAMYVADTLQEALDKAYSIQTKLPKIILLENDLPDNY